MGLELIKLIMLNAAAVWGYLGAWNVVQIGWQVV
jgi:hypothetical protein